MIIPELIGYFIEKLAIAVWNSRIVRWCRVNWPQDMHWFETYAICVLAAIWAFLCIAGLA